MCKVTKYRFGCEHCLKIRNSSCGGSRSKQTRSSTKAACCAEAYITIKLLLDCNKCQQDAWTQSWKRKLRRATTFRDELTQKALPGTDEISRLVMNLEDEYASTAWRLSKIYPQAQKASIGRVRPAMHDAGEEKRLASPLKKEVQPYEILGRSDTVNKGEAYHNDDNYVRGTDSITTDHVRPLHSINSSWVCEHLFAAKELRNLSTEVDVGFDPTTSEWDRGGQNYVDANDQGAVGGTEGKSPEAKASLELTAWGPDAEADLLAAEIGMDGLSISDERHQTEIQEVISAFWEVVGTEGDIEQRLLLSGRATNEIPYYNTSSENVP